MPDYSGGIWIQAEAGTENEISYLELDSATTGIMIQRENGLKMDHSTLSSNLYFAIHAYADNSLLANGLVYNKFVNNGVHHVMVQPSDMVHWGAGNTFVGDSKGVLVDYGVLSESGTLIKLDVPYYIQDYMVVENPSSNITLTIEPGAHLFFSEMAYIQMDERATLHAVGLWLRALSGSAHQLEYVSIRNAKTGVYVEEGSSLAIDHSSVVESQFYGWIKETGTMVNMGTHMNFSGNLVGDYW